MQEVLAILDRFQKRFIERYALVQFLVTANVVALVIVAFIGGIRGLGEVSALDLMYGWVVYLAAPFNFALIVGHFLFAARPDSDS